MRTYTRWLVITGLYLGCAQFVFLAFLQNPGNEYGKARLPEMVDWSGHRPFVYRTLLPSTVHLIDMLLPGSVRRILVERAEAFGPLQRLFDDTPAPEEQNQVLYLIAYALEFTCLLLFALTLRGAILHFYAPSRWLADFLPAIALAGLPCFFRYVSYDYDFPQIFLFTLGFLLLARRQWRRFYGVLILSAFNKETAVLLVVVHVLGNFSQMPHRVLIIHAGVQVVVCAAARLLLQFVVFVDNPGGSLEVWIGRNYEMILNPSQWSFLLFHFAWVGNKAAVMPANYNLLLAVLVAPLVFWRWADKPVLLRRGLWLAPILVVCTFFFGYFDEVRAYCEVYPIVFLLAVGTICYCAEGEPVSEA